MQPLTAEQLAALPPEVAAFTAVICIPSVGKLFACPNFHAPLHECPAAFTVPQALRLASTLNTAGSDAHVLVYGIPWGEP